MFIKYQHVEKFGNINVEGIENGKCYIFPKLDGTNGSVWCEDGNIVIASRNKLLNKDNNNFGFYQYIISNDKINIFFEKYPNLRLYGEWLIPHTLKTYEDSAWNKFYIFDVCEAENDTIKYLHYDVYKPILEEFELDYVVCLASITNPSYDNLCQWMENNTFLIKDGCGNGEGIVIKNYEYVNKFGRMTWAKMVLNEFKAQHSRIMGHPDIKGKECVEQRIVDKYVSSDLIEKEYQKIIHDNEGWDSKKIPALFGRVYNSLIIDDIWAILKEHKNPTINFNKLYSLIIVKIKSEKPELF